MLTKFKRCETNTIAVIAWIAIVCLLWIRCGLVEDPVMLTTPQITRRNRAYNIPYPLNPGCGTVVNDGTWTTSPKPVRHCHLHPEYATCSSIAIRRWIWADPALHCKAARKSISDLKLLLSKKWIACLGDSIARNICLALLQLASPSDVPLGFERHADFHSIIHYNDSHKSQSSGRDAQISFFWAPFTQNVSDTLALWRTEKTPDIVVVSAGLWDMLYFNDKLEYTSKLEELSNVTKSLLTDYPAGRTPIMIYSTNVEVQHGLLTDPKKRKMMVPEAVDAYNTAIYESGILSPQGSYGILDMWSLTYGCSRECSTDGIHSIQEVYTTAAQIIMNQFSTCTTSLHIQRNCWASS